MSSDHKEVKMPAEIDEKAIVSPAGTDLSDTGRQAVWGLSDGLPTQEPPDSPPPPERSYGPPLSDQTRMEIYRIQKLPVEERREAMASFHESLRHKHKEEYRSLKRRVGILNNGEGIGVVDNDGQEVKIWYVPGKEE